MDWQTYGKFTQLLYKCNETFSPDGYLYDKEAILEYILHQKREIARHMKEYERQKRKEEVGVILKIRKHYCELLFSNRLRFLI